MSKQAEKHPKGHKSRGLSLFLVILLFAGAAGFFYYQSYQSNLQPYTGTAEEASLFTVEKGWTLTRIATELENAGYIRSAKDFVTYGKLKKTGGKLQAGNYLLSPSMSAEEVMNELVKGQVIVKTFTIPEGYHLRQICTTFVAEGISTEDAFWDAVKNGQYDYGFLEGLPKDDKRLEGYLFPDTYTIAEGTPVEKVLDRMLKRFSVIFEGLPENTSGLSMTELVTLASIVENEAKIDEERPMIASVFLNRLRDGMRLESCATIQYHFEEKKSRLLYADLEIDSPYNTYRHEGLPPGPICSPGKASLEAVAQPANTDYYFFVAKEDGSGGHVFSHSLSEHNKAKWTIRN